MLYPHLDDRGPRGPVMGRLCSTLEVDGILVMWITFPPQENETLVI